MVTKSFFSEDVVQEITSANEMQQTKISLKNLEKVLKPHQMRNVLGGSVGVYAICCKDYGESGCTKTYCSESLDTSQCGLNYSYFKTANCPY